MSSISLCCYRYNPTPPQQRQYQPPSYRQQTPSESHYAPRSDYSRTSASDYASRDAYDRKSSNYGSIGQYQREGNATPQYGQIGQQTYDYGSRRRTPTSQIVRQKPPTPPPQRDRSKSPSNAVSPIFGKKPQVVIDSERKYQERLEREAARARAANEPDYQKPKKSKAPGPSRPYESELKQKFRQSDNSETEEDGNPSDFGYLNNMVQSNRQRNNSTPQYATKSILKRSQSGSQDSNYAYNNYGSVGSNGGQYNNYYGTNSIDSMGSSAISGFSAPEIYASPYRYGDSTPQADVSIL